MTNRFWAAAALLACAFALQAEDALYQIDLVPSGKVISKDVPVTKGMMLLFHKYPDGTLISMRRSEVKVITKISAQAAIATNPAESVVQIGNLAFQGGSSQAGPTNLSVAGARAGAPTLGKGFYSTVVPGQTIANPNSPGDYQVGRTFAGPPPNAVQTVPGAPPSMPAATSGQNPPQ
jgi:hypothetical protein